MVIDDQPGVRRLICEALQQAGFNVTVATEGKEALTKITSEEPDLVILDIKMPGMSGVEFLKELRKRSFFIPVIIITAYTELDVEEQATRFGASYFLHKPFDIQQLYRMVKNLLQPGYCQFQAVAQV